jgi:predicted short-subunit dehydrogenase-like oxidoreductase (DUF2520 family)
MMKTLSIIGAGRVGQTLGKLWARKGVFEIHEVLNRSVESASAAVAFLGTGRVVGRIQNMSSAEVFMISVPDAQIAACSHALVQTGLLEPGNIVFHCSGALPASVLGSARASGASVGSLHPVKSFVNPALAQGSFAESFCGIEGDTEAVSVLWEACKAIGGRPFKIDPEFKTLYHAGAVIVCNYMTALLEWGMQCFDKAGLERSAALKLIEPMVRDTVKNIFQANTVTALTGPIARGDHEVVAQQLQAMSQCSERFGRLYQDLGAIALELSHAQGTASPESLASLEKLLYR